ncbi:MAG: 4'-phosphopantetheinyl transferase superfamily protein, partial [Desulfatiglandales bacterium]
NPRQTEIRHLLSYDDGFVLAHVRISLVEGALKADEEELLREQLTGEEIKRYRSLKHPKRRLEWLAGRIVAKGAIRIYLGSNAPLPSAIEVESSPDNAPHIVIKGEEADSALPHISISHSSDMAVAVAAQSLGVGIDVEEITESILEIADEFSTNEEVERVSKCTGPDRLIVLVSIWAVKEAARKAVGPQTCSMKELVLREARKEGDYVVCEISHPTEGRLRSVTFQNNKYVYAISLPLRTTID